ncbi:unnamed protein product [Rotaria sp. Silwood2]|nr:unnamed protein product [Rotaria sp. Silwood2]CAF4229103.1 unnamed protein product [Rotaria sp. Silwood2]
MSSTTRIFSFGLGHSPSRSLVKGLARATNGHFIFIPPYSRVDSYIGIQLSRALQPSFVNSQLQWSGLWPSGSQAPRTIPPVYQNDRVLVYTLFDTFQFTGQSALVDYTTENGRIGRGSLNRNDVHKGDMIRRLAAKALIQELQHRGSVDHVYDGMTVKQRIIALSLTHQILSPYTAFVGVETTRSKTSSTVQVRPVPIQTSKDDEHLPSQNGFSSTQSPQFIPQGAGWLPPVAALPTHVPPPSQAFAYPDMLPPVLMSQGTGAKGESGMAQKGELGMAHKGERWGFQYAPQEMGQKGDRGMGQKGDRGMGQKGDRGMGQQGDRGMGQKGDYGMVQYGDFQDVTEAYAVMRRPDAINPVLQSTTQPSSPSTTTSFDSTTDENKPSPVADPRKPSANTDSVRWLIDQQSFNGAWILTDDQVQQLTGGKSWTYFKSKANQDKDVITTALAIALLESQHVKQKNLWFMVADKGRRRLLDFGLNKNEIDLLINEIRSKL